LALVRADSYRILDFAAYCASPVKCAKSHSETVMHQRALPFFLVFGQFVPEYFFRDCFGRLNSGVIAAALLIGVRFWEPLALTFLACRRFSDRAHCGVELVHRKGSHKAPTAPAAVLFQKLCGPFPLGNCIKRLYDGSI
jgi:hypothetical protein